MSSETDELRRALWEAGYRPVAVKTNNKAPLGDAWQLRARATPPEAVARPAMAKALNTGILCDGLRAIDIDIEDEALATACEELIAGLIGMGPVRTRGGGKRLIVYRAAEGEPVKRWVAGPGGKVEVLGKGQQFVAYGRHPSGSNYEWRDGQDLVRVPLSDILYVSEDEITAVLNECAVLIGGKTEAQREAEKAAPLPLPVAAAGPVDEGRGRAYAVEVLQRLARDLAGNPKGGRNNALNDAAMRCGALSARGWLSEAECRQALISACHANGLAKEDGHRACEKTFRSGFGAGVLKPAADPVERDAGETGVVIALRPRAAVAADDGTIYDEETGEVLEAVNPDERSIFNGIKAVRRDAGWHDPKGLLGDMAKWILETSRRPNAPLAVSAAVAVLSGVCGRHLFGPTLTSLNLYIVGLAGSTVGKGRPLSAVSEILTGVGLSQICGSAKVFSVSAMETMLMDQPCTVATVDEIGANLLSRMSSKSRSTHEAAMKPALLELWSRALGMAPFHTHGRSGSKSVHVHNPSLTIYGVSTPEAFYESLSAGSVKDGFLNRLLLVKAAPRGETREAVAPKVPPEFKTRIMALLPEMQGNIASSAGPFSGLTCPEGEALQWHDDKARSAALKLEDELLDLMESLPAEKAALCGRAFEMTVRLASLHAVSRGGREAKVHLSDLEWGFAWVAESVDTMISGVEKYMATNEHQAAYNEIMAIITERPMISQSEILRFTRGRIDTRLLKSVLQQLVGSEQVREVEKKKAGPGRPATLYVRVN
ncbi:MAG: bifunctional DNA primase/polymerase [Aestuariivirga sp.]